MLSDSHAAPYFDGGVWVNLSTPQLDADGTPRGTVTLSGRIRSDLCDLIKGNQGTLGNILVSLNGEPLTPDASSSIVVHKNDIDPKNPSLTHPYPTYTDFTLVFNNVEVSTGLNWLRLAVADSVPESGLTGFAEYSWVVTATQIVPLDGGFDSTWLFDNSAPVEVSKCDRGELHPYNVRLRGPAVVLRYASELWPRTFVKGADGNYYCASDRDTPKVGILTFFRKPRELLTPSGPLDSLNEATGFFYGFTSQSIDDIKGGAKIAVLNYRFPGDIAAYLKAYVDITRDSATESEIRLVINVGTQAEQLSAAAKSAWNLWKAVDSNNWTALEAAASGDSDDVRRQSETLRWLAAYMVEAMVAINNKYVAANPFEKGEIKGRVTVEVAMIILPFTKAGQLTKVTVITKLTEAPWIRENPQLYQIIQDALKLIQAEKPPPVIPGVTPLPVPALPAGMDAGLLSERIAGELFAQIQQGVPPRPAFVNAVMKVAADAGAGVITIQFEKFQAEMVARAPQGFFSTVEEAADFMQNLLTYGDYQKWRGGKNFAVVMAQTGEGFFIPAGSKGVFEGNHVIKQQLQKVLRDNYGIGSIGTDQFIEKETPVKILTTAEHRLDETSFHKRLNAWNNNVLSDWNLPNIKEYSLPDGTKPYTQAYQVLDEYILFLRAYPEYQDTVPVVRAFAKIHGIPITK